MRRTILEATNGVCENKQQYEQAELAAQKRSQMGRIPFFGAGMRGATTLRSRSITTNHRWTVSAMYAVRSVTKL